MSRRQLISLNRGWGFLRDTEDNRLLQDDVLLAADRTRNEVTSTAYEYYPFMSGVPSVRLLELLPGTRQEDIACRLYEIRLNDCMGSYEALSYAWGDTSQKTPIQVNGRTLNIGTELRLALLNLRQDTPRILWIDAICINQEDIDERNRQVIIMGEIYRQARRTVVWLGDEVEKVTKTAFAMLEDFADAAMSEEPLVKASALLQGKAHLSNFPKFLAVKDNTGDPVFDIHEGDKTAIQILEKPWLHRAWTQQEILLASNAIVLAGRYTIDWDRMCMGANHGLNLTIWNPPTMGSMMDPLIVPFLSIQLVERLLLQSSGVPPAQLLLDLLIYSRFREAKDPRDKIYSLLGLVTAPADHYTSSSAPVVEPGRSMETLGIWPDYASPANTVYTHVARQLVREAGSLDVLGACASADATLGMPDSGTSGLLGAGLPFPSWVPDWSIATSLTANPLLHDALDRRRTTHATKNSRADPLFVDAGCTTLVLQSYEITSLASLAQPLFQNMINTSSYAIQGLPIPDQTVFGRLARLRVLCRAILSRYELLSRVVPHLAVYADWEKFAQKVASTNPGAPSQARTVAAEGGQSAGNLSIGITTTTNSADKPEVEEPTDWLATYWQTLCTGTYPVEGDHEMEAGEGRGPKIAPQNLFYSWRASLKPIRDLHYLGLARTMKLLAFIGYVRKTWKGYSTFFRFVENSYGRRLARGANGYLCLVPAKAMKGDRIILAKGGRVPLVVRPTVEVGYWEFVGEAYIHGIMDGEAWDSTRCHEFKLR